MSKPSNTPRNFINNVRTNKLGIDTIYLSEPLGTDKEWDLDLTREFADAVAENTSARGIAVTRTTMSPEVLQIIADGIKRNPRLLNVDLSQNEIGEPGAEILADMVRSSGIKSFCVDANKLGDKGLGKISSAIINSNVETLGLKFNQITDEGISKFVDQLTPERTFSFLDLSNNQISNKLQNRLSRMDNFEYVCHGPKMGGSNIEQKVEQTGKSVTAITATNLSTGQEVGAETAIIR